MIKEFNYTWEEIYKEWNYMSYHIPIINEKLHVNKIKVNQWNREHEYFYGLDWMLNEDFEDRTNYVAEQTTMFMMNGECLNKGTLTTLRYLVDAEDKETRAAIWIYAFIRDVLEYHLENWRGEAYRIAYAVETAARIYLQGKGMEWHHAMKKLLPDIYFTHTILEAVNIEDKRIVLELVAMTVDYIHMHYKVAEYDSRK
jgi:hypothetical protein